MSEGPPSEPGSGERPIDEPVTDDPYSLDDPEARAREERRLERERQRRERAEGRPGGGKRAAGGRGRGLLRRRRKPPGDGVGAAPPTEVRTDGGQIADEAPPPAAAPPTAERTRTTDSHRRPPGVPPTAAIRRRRIAAVLLAGGALLLWLLLVLFQPLGGEGEGKVVVTIPKGATASEVGEILEQRGVISGGPPLVSGSTLFRVRLSMAGKSGDVQSGSYTLASGMSYGAAIDALTAPASERGATVVVPEGYTRDQIYGITQDAGLKGNYKKATLSSKLIALKDYGAEGAENLEGFLFPATYELEPKSKVEDFVELQLEEFQRNFKTVDMKYAESKNLTPYDVLIIASMIDREVQIPEERELVGEVIYNRLSAGEPLAIDATIRYVTGNFDEQLTESELNIDSPYNTRLVAGLPPGPIGNPGLDAIDAAANPGKGNARFYVVKPGTCGEHVFTDSEQEFNQAAERYQRALERQGGSPTEC